MSWVEQSKNKHVHSGILRVNYFISLLLLFLVVDGPLQTNAMLMYLNINGSELKTAVLLTPHALLGGMDATVRPTLGH